MSYTIHKASGTGVTVVDSTITGDISLTLSSYNPVGGDAGLGLGIRYVGRNTPDYGSAIAQNFLQLTENFASNAVPADGTVLQGQLWYNKASGVSGDLFVRSNNALSGGIANWAKVLTVNASGNLSISGSMAATSFIGNLTGNASTVTTNANLTGDVTSVGNVTTLSLSGATAGTYGSTTQVPVITVNAKGRVTSVSNISISGVGGTLQTVTDAGATTNNAITFSGTGAGTAYIDKVTGQTYLDLNGVCWAVDGAAPGIAPPSNVTHFCGGDANRWSGMYTDYIDMTGELHWGAVGWVAPTNTGTKFLCDNGTWATPAGGGGGSVGTLQQVTDAGASTTNTITFSTVGGSATIGVTPSTSWLQLNNNLGVAPGIGGGIAPLPAFAGQVVCGGPLVRWQNMYTNDIDLTGSLHWGAVGWVAPTNTGTKFLCDNGTWATPAGGGGGSVGTLQQVTDLGATTSNHVSFNSTVTHAQPITILNGTGNAYVGTVSNLNWLDLNGACYVVNGGLPGIIPPTSGTHYCGASIQPWNIVYGNAFISPSDLRQKEYIQDSDLGLEFINKLRPVSYKWKNQNVSTDTQYGLIAQEVAALPESANFAGLSHDDENDVYSMAYIQFIAPMLKAIQELSAKNVLLEARLAALEAQ